MGTLFWLITAQTARLHRHAPDSHVPARGDDLRVLSGITLIDRQWRAVVRCADGPWIDLDPPQSLIAPMRPWIFVRITVGLVAGSPI